MAGSLLLPFMNTVPVCCFVKGSSKVNQAIQDNFTAAVNCWNFLHSNMTYNKGMYICIYVHHKKTVGIYDPLWAYVYAKLDFQV